MALFNAWSFQRLAKDLVDLVEEGEDLLAEDRLHAFFNAGNDMFIYVLYIPVSY